MEPITKEDESNVQAIYSKIREWRNAHSPASAFSILHAPLRYRDVPLLIIGQNPAKNGTKPSEQMHPPSRSFMFESAHRYAFTAQALFYRPGRTNHLRYAQSTDVNFFCDLDTPEARVTCASALRDLIDVLSPKRILLNGIGAAESFLEIRGILPIPRVNFGVLLKDVFVCPHFSRRSDPPLDEWDRVIRDLATFLPEHEENELGARRSES